MNVNQTFPSIERIRGQISAQDNVRKGEQCAPKTTQSFDEILFSKHASKRLETRQIDMTQEQRNNTVITAVKDTNKAVFTNIDGAIIN